ncbi:MAG: hypothetical protein N2053_11500 [Chitinispirillaceae bacterium]|nr:hypothetical protein [Chitinispirillaceae bacterium]
MPKICIIFLNKNRWIINSSFFRVQIKELVFYHKVGIKLWKDRLPVMSGGELDRKHLRKEITIEYLDQMITATCYTEVIHLVCGITGFLSIGSVLLLPKPLPYLPFFSIIALLNFLTQLPFILVQRYNRARFLRVGKTLFKTSKYTIPISN